MSTYLGIPGAGYVYRRLHNAVQYRLRTAATGHLADYCRPSDIAILMTNICNAKCVHCDIWKNRDRVQAPAVADYKRALSEIRNWLGPVHVYFTGGEALIRPQTPELVAFCGEIGLWAEVLTHGYWEDQSKIEKLALANPGRVTVSLDGIGSVHTLVRGHPNFFERTSRSLDTLRRIRAERKLSFTIRLKTVIMRHNLHDVENVARYAREHGDEVLYQAIEQNYNTPENPRWFETSPTWPDDTPAAVETIKRLMAMKPAGFPIRNSLDQFEAMIRYFQDPDSMRVAIQQHVAHEARHACSALTMLHIGPDGGLIACSGMPAIGNIRDGSVREIWDKRPRWWKQGCCFEARTSEAEKTRAGLISIGSSSTESG